MLKLNSRVDQYSGFLYFINFNVFFCFEMKQQEQWIPIHDPLCMCQLPGCTGCSGSGPCVSACKRDAHRIPPQARARKVGGHWHLRAVLQAREGCYHPAFAAHSMLRQNSPCLGWLATTWPRGCRSRPGVWRRPWSWGPTSTSAKWSDSSLLLKEMEMRETQIRERHHLKKMRFFEMTCRKSYVLGWSSVRGGLSSLCMTGPCGIVVGKAVNG